MRYPRSLATLIERLKRLPGVGEKTAQRLAFFILKIPREEVERLARALVEVKERIHHCSVCYALTDEDPCTICRSPDRDRSLICVVEEPNDQMAIERTGEFKGSYHVLMGALSPLDGVGPQDIKIAELVERIQGGGIKEVILATNPNMEGEATALYLAKHLRPLGVKVTRIARGLPVGGDLEYADEMTLARSLEGRREL